MAQIIVPTAEVKGNVSSCKTEISVVNCASRDSLFWCNDVGYATNNCTGETTQFSSWSLTGTSAGIGLLLGFLCIVGVMRLAMD